MKIEDMPKLESPFVRKVINSRYVVTPEINPGYEWVFDDKETMAIEKLDGTNVSVNIEDGIIKSVFNRTARIPFFNKGSRFIINGVQNAFDRGYIDLLGDGQHFGEVIGPKLGQNHEAKEKKDIVNPYRLEENIWIPFKTYSQDKLRYKSWGKYPTDFDNISKWFETELMALYSLRVNGKEFADHYVEGIVFTHPDGRMAKLRRDMFDWYKGTRHMKLSPEDIFDASSGDEKEVK